MRVPYPDINSPLAVMSHMYICKSINNKEHKFIKCQTLKPYMLTSDYNPMNNYHDEIPDKNRNPFSKPTRIDCDKLFNSYTVNYDSAMLTTTRRDVSDDLYKILIGKLSLVTISEIDLDENDLVYLDPLISF